ncbi:MAG: hypothetical protein WC829_07225 [Hyphomicrobium sp.]|jgi:hypothetical protein
MRSLACIALLLAVAAAFSVPADAGRRKGARAWQPAPVKECPRLNGRFGYYGNPWCTKAEQDAWDRATSRRTVR